MRARAVEERERLPTPHDETRDSHSSQTHSSRVSSFGVTRDAGGGWERGSFSRSFKMQNYKFFIFYSNAQKTSRAKMK